ncbi:hypothetical protein Shyhy01_25580 [Streptomyces hygroscopicus subsp. hygroscopicus]|nr:hypothetical protein Shyhy01_25580 [Streptomyces hygroscopicus subsp. hygroscopicus]
MGPARSSIGGGPYARTLPSRGRARGSDRWCDGPANTSWSRRTRRKPPDAGEDTLVATARGPAAAAGRRRPAPVPISGAPVPSPRDDRRPARDPQEARRLRGRARLALRPWARRARAQPQDKRKCTYN